MRNDIVKRSAGKDERGDDIPQLASDLPISGLALSGGGIRSAAFSLGVMQGLEAVRGDFLDNLDYMSTVSGGGYMGGSVIAGLLQKGKFPYPSLLGKQETVGTKHIRDYASYLNPHGFGDVLAGLITLARGLLINAVIFSGVILTLVAATVLLKPTKDSLADPLFPAPSCLSGLGWFPWTVVAFAFFFAVQLAYTLIALRSGSGRMAEIRLTTREGSDRLFTWFLRACFLIFALECQPYVLLAMVTVADWPDKLAVAAGKAIEPKHVNALADLLHWLGFGGPVTFTVLLGVATTLAAFSKKLLAILGTTAGDASWSGSMKRWASKAGLYLVALIVPFLLWLVYLRLCFAALHATPPSNAGVFVLLALVLIALALFVSPNANSLHRYFRDRLSRAFIWDGHALGPDDPSIGFPSPTSRLPKGTDLDRLKLSHLTKAGAPAAWHDAWKRGPYLLVNTSVNLEGSHYLNQRGRNADSFFFSPLFSGSSATGYASTRQLEQIHPDLDLPTAIAISGAAASANMGASTIPALTFSLAVLNIRLGYWLPNPLFAGVWKQKSLVASIGPFYYAMEVVGKLRETTRNVYLTDGGHFDNLGVYELLRRHCKVIVVADAEADPAMTFDSLVRLQRYARIDRGILIDLPWPAICAASKAVTPTSTRGAAGDPSLCHGPHVAVGRVDYGLDTQGKREYGVLIYLKSSLTGDESDLIRDYLRRNAAFPHETTLDQFFSEEQFEVYRALGFHIANNFFAGRDKAAMLPADTLDDWPEQVGHALRRLQLSAAAVKRIVDRQKAAA
ncbi:patatin-like phospholipase family protein [Labrys monachus]|uniref:Acylesterase/phospholipase RssA n=1 Tax=Labrys monachus TaxID=217067 RepID=A0ABU0FJ19_9HYPH|nr:patatin-like phospholipase family protein [Labrys monachus]MDQ0394486.1 putative acylesterase/phospholipase RssA [Labrys monachus]